MPLNRDQIKYFRQDLEARNRALREEISEELKRSQEESYVELAGRVRDSAEASVADLLQDMELAHIDRHVQQASAIDRALGAIQAGDYGDCIECGGTINVERLKVAPWVERCIDCQSKWEREHYTEGAHGKSL